MFNNGSAPSVADIAAVTNGGGGFGGWGRGGAFGGGSCGCDSACATVGDVERGFNQQSTNMRFNAVDNAFAQLGYANQQNAYETRLAITNAQNAQQQCCCDTQRAIDGVRYDMSQGFAQQGYQNQQCCCDLQNTMNANTQTILNQLNAYRMEDKNDTIAELRSQVQALNLAQSQANQNQYLLGRLQPPAVPSYQVANPYATYAGTGCCGSCCC